ncbi:MAG: CsbD family protein [Pseudomonadota bacterium]
MTADAFKGKWKEMKGKLRTEFGELTDDELEAVKGDREQLEGLIQKRYGKAKAEVRDMIDDLAKAA